MQAANCMELLPEELNIEIINKLCNKNKFNIRLVMKKWLNLFYENKIKFENINNIENKYGDSFLHRYAGLGEVEHFCDSSVTLFNFKNYYGNTAFHTASINHTLGKIIKHKKFQNVFNKIILDVNFNNIVKNNKSESIWDLTSPEDKSDIFEAISLFWSEYMEIYNIQKLCKILNYFGINTEEEIAKDIIKYIDYKIQKTEECELMELRLKSIFLSTILVEAIIALGCSIISSNAGMQFNNITEDTTKQIADNFFDSGMVLGIAPAVEIGVGYIIKLLYSKYVTSINPSYDLAHVLSFSNWRNKQKYSDQLEQGDLLKIKIYDSTTNYNTIN